MVQERIAKLIRDSGFCSRREAEQYIKSHKVSVNGLIIDDCSLKFDRSINIEISGKRITLFQESRLWLFHKPLNVIVSKNDPQNRKTIFEMVYPEIGNVISAGRLDYKTEGLLILTNNAKIAQKLENPKNKYLRIYRVRCFNKDNKLKQDINKASIIYNGIRYNIEYIKLIENIGSNAWYECAIREGKNREVRNIFNYFNLKINKLIRIAYGPFKLNNLRKGELIEIKKINI